MKNNVFVLKKYFIYIYDSYKLAFQFTQPVFFHLSNQLFIYNR